MRVSVFRGQRQERAPLALARTGDPGTTVQVLTSPQRRNRREACGARSRSSSRRSCTKGIAYYHYNVPTDPVATKAAEAELTPQAGWSFKERMWKGRSKLMLESRSVARRRYVRVVVEPSQYKVNTGGYPCPRPTRRNPP